MFEFNFCRGRKLAVALIDGVSHFVGQMHEGVGSHSVAAGYRFAAVAVVADALRHWNLP